MRPKHRKQTNLRRALVWLLLAVATVSIYLPLADLLRHLLAPRLFDEYVTCQRSIPLVGRRNNISSLPSCLRAWAEIGRTDVEKGLKERGFAIATGPVMYQCNTRSGATFGQVIADKVHHLPHFCEGFFNFFSLMNWQVVMLQEPCIDSVVVDHRTTSFWRKSAMDANSDWMRELIDAVNSYFQTISITSSRCSDENPIRSFAPKVVKGGLHGWFLHPIDAVLLSSYILNERPCEKVSSQFLSCDHLEVLIVDRKVGRRIAQPSSIQKQLSRKQGIAKITITSFEGGRGALFLQARRVRTANVFISTHGAGNTNIAFLRPCSIFIEIFPYLFYVPQYFGSLAKQTEILHFTIQVDRNSSHRFYPIKRQCTEAFSKVESLTNEVRNEACFADNVCRRCARDVDSIDVNYNKLSSVLDIALTQRAECIRTSYYYKFLTYHDEEAKRPMPLA